MPAHFFENILEKTSNPICLLVSHDYSPLSRLLVKPVVYWLAVGAEKPAQFRFL